jgi:penicillin-binding protein-related factor A (putative recombinase)
MKNKIGAFSLDRVDDHQYASLLQIKQSGGLTAVILGVWIPRQDYWFMCFDPEFLLNIVEGGKKSINKKEITFYCEHGFNISLRSKDLSNFKPEMLRDKIINFLPD